ncbi:MAG: hypothetical protein JXQ29_00200 [Planctomycetes bacterium]|nr:hypothetical protein [Planctomycetota bacterium]
MPNPLDTFYFDFQKPYQYLGGDLVVFITHDGSDQTTATYMDYVAPATVGGWGGYGTGYNATTASYTTYFHVMRFQWGYGSMACTGTGGRTPFMIASNDLVPPVPPPGTVNFAITNALGGATGFIVVGFYAVKIPLPNGCELLVAPILATLPFALSSSGRFDLNIPFPAAVMGAVTAQAAVFDPGAKGGYVGTNGITFTFKP